MSQLQQRLEAMLRRAGGCHREGTALVAQCPRCGKAKLHFRVYVPEDHRRAADENQIRLRFTCFSGSCAGWDGRPEFALAEMLGMRVRAVQAELYGRGLLASLPPQRGAIPILDTEDELEALPPEPAPVRWPAQFYPIDHQAAEPGAAYLEGRGIPVDVARQYGVRYSVVDRSVVFPVEERGVLWGWQTRLIIPHTWIDEQGMGRESNKCSTSDGLVRSRWMFGDKLLHSEHALTLEGPCDAIKAHLCGGNVASMGKVITPALLKALAAYPWRRLYCGLDPGTPAETRKLVWEFDQVVKHAGREVYLVEWPDRLDPKTGKRVDAGALSFEEVYGCWRGARRVRAEQEVWDLI